MGTEFEFDRSGKISELMTIEGYSKEEIIRLMRGCCLDQIERWRKQAIVDGDYEAVRHYQNMADIVFEIGRQCIENLK